MRCARADPRYAKPHAELALAYFIRGMHFMQPMREVGPFVRAEVTRALELDPTDPQRNCGGVAAGIGLVRLN